MATKKVFLAAQGRSGSTLIWNMLRQLPEFTTYYEPLHPTLIYNVKDKCGYNEKLRHFGVNNYWKEYNVISLDELERNKAETSDSNEKVKEYFDFLADKALKDKVFYKTLRLWGRLKWLRETYPDATIIHLARTPIAQWNSSQYSEMERDYFAEWKHGYKEEYPYLDRLNDYEFFNAIWELSYIEGQTNADVTFHYEGFKSEPEQSTKLLALALGYERKELAAVVPLMSNVIVTDPPPFKI